MCCTCVSLSFPLTPVSGCLHPGVRRLALYFMLLPVFWSFFEPCWLGNLSHFVCLPVYPLLAWLNRATKRALWVQPVLNNYIWWCAHFALVSLNLWSEFRCICIKTIFHYNLVFGTKCKEEKKTALCVEQQQLPLFCHLKASAVKLWK